jgi:surface protein
LDFINCNGDCDCPTGTWQQSSSIPNQDVYVTTELKYTIEYFGNCINGVCPPVKNKQKSVTPGYNTPGCEAWKYEEISCRAAEAMYKQVLELRYGISNCCPEEDKQYIVQKELIDLAALYDPAYPCSTNSCGCNNNCNCSTAEPVCPPTPLTYNCFCTQSACECIEIGNGSGEYSTLALCQAACVPLPITSYNCTKGTCVLVSGPGGQYPTLEACEEDCTPPPVTSYNCTNGECILVSGSGGEYPTLIACQDDCGRLTSYNCTDCECISVSGPGGDFPTLQDCIDAGCSDDSFITIWETTTAGESITLPYVSAGTYSGTIDWGDGNTSLNSYANRTHIYATPGIYTITICGDVIGWNFGLIPVSASKINSVVQWGQLRLFGGQSHFRDCTNLDLSSVSDTLDLTGVTLLTAMFFGCTSLTTINNINSWDTSAITNMSSMFNGCSVFNQALTFNTSLVTNMNAMFTSCLVFNSAITFNTIAVINMGAMFFSCANFNQPLLFNTIAVTNMNGMFGNCTNFNQPLPWNTVAVLNMAGMFANCTNFNQPLPWNTGAVTNMAAMFASAPAFQQNLGAWTITSVTDFTNFMAFKTPATWSQTNFDLLLCGWSPQIVTPSLTIDFGSANFTNATSLACKNVLTGAPNFWFITDGGGV